MSNKNLKFKLIDKSDLRFLFNHLKERDPKDNISHKKIPTYDEHVKFVLSEPYLKWYIILQENKKIGSVYLTHNDEIGLHLKKDCFVNDILQKIFELLRDIVPKNKFVVNVSPRNTKFMNFLKKNGFIISQQTYVLYF